MVQDLLQREAFAGLFREQLADKVCCEVRDVAGDLQVDVDDAIVRVALGKGSIADQELVGEHAQGPQVDTLVILDAQYQLGGDVIGRAAHCLALLPRRKKMLRLKK